MRKKNVIVFILLLFVVGCGGRKYIPPTTDTHFIKGGGIEEEKESKGLVSEGKKGEEKKKGEEYTPLGEEKIEESEYPITEEGVTEQREALIKEQEGAFQDILFDYDSYEIRADAEPILKSLVSWLKEHGGVKILLEGHCDERGTNEYNLALGERRAIAVKDYLVFSGISPDRIETVSYGEERPLCTEKTESCYQKNRRVHIVLSK
ncbi:MAG: peptidoglycan-associated lipoprotein Pal [Nitrospirae bacterium]|nr:MAG: peptidoglycan-associated lipoprotein Pal [Nitrospirota bacterium]